MRHPGPESSRALQTLSVIVPTPRETGLLRACLQSGQAGCRAWEAWCQEVGDPLKALLQHGKRTRGLLPLLLSALRRNGVPTSGPLMTHLRAAHFRERLRSRVYRRICEGVISALTHADVPTIVLRGAALAETVYREAALRHCHDIDLLVRSDELAGAIRAVAPLGFRWSPRTPRDAVHITLTHASGLPLALHGGLFEMPNYDVPFDELWNRSQVRSIAGTEARVPSSDHHLLHVCGHASYSRSRHSLRWVCDAWSIIEHDPTLEWEHLFDTACRGRLAIPASVTLGYLARELGARIGPALLDRLHGAALRADASDMEAAALGIAQSSRRRLERTLRLPRGWGRPLALAKSVLFRGE